MRLPRPTRRRLAGLALLAFATLGGGLWWLAYQGRVTKANFDRIRARKGDWWTGHVSEHNGSTRQEVLELLGPPSEDTGVRPGPGPRRTCSWYRFPITIGVSFDHRDMAQEALFHRHAARDWLQRWWGRTIKSSPPF
jgi:hypothetical protein